MDGDTKDTAKMLQQTREVCVGRWRGELGEEGESVNSIRIRKCQNLL